MSRLIEHAQKEFARHQIDQQKNLDLFSSSEHVYQQLGLGPLVWFLAEKTGMQLRDTYWELSPGANAAIKSDTRNLFALDGHSSPRLIAHELGGIQRLGEHGWGPHGAKPYHEVENPQEGTMGFVSVAATRTILTRDQLIIASGLGIQQFPLPVLESQIDNIANHLEEAFNNPLVEEKQSYVLRYHQERRIPYPQIDSTIAERYFIESGSHYTLPEGLHWDALAPEVISAETSAIQKQITALLLAQS
jgi:hypothetical protein